VFIAPVLWILEAVPVPLAGLLDVLPANLRLLAVAIICIHHRQGLRATTRRGLVTAVAQLEYSQLAIEKNKRSGILP